MSEKVIEHNKVSVIGEVISGFTFSHEVFGEGFYLVDLAVNRLSEQTAVSYTHLDVYKRQPLAMAANALVISRLVTP